MTRPKTGFAYLDEPEGPIVFAHRGGARHADLLGLENTMAAFSHAVGLGYRYLETDVHASRDGVLYAFHDATLDRLTDRSGAIADLTAAEVDRARIAGHEAIPRLTDVLDAFPEARLNIDIKAPGAVRSLADLVEGRGDHDRVLIGSFQEGSLRQFRRAVSRPVATATGPVGVAGALLRVPGALVRDTGVAFQVPVRHKGVRIVTTGFVRRAHAGGRHVHVWTVDQAAQMRRLLDMGVDGIFTDRTDVLREVLMARGQWHSSGHESGSEDDV
ncbi:MAG: glycerophosphodiester phosphodiesterase [Nocardioidaceae bacterium]